MNFGMLQCVPPWITVLSFICTFSFYFDGGGFVVFIYCICLIVGGPRCLGHHSSKWMHGVAAYGHRLLVPAAGKNHPIMRKFFAFWIILATNGRIGPLHIRVGKNGHSKSFSIFCCLILLTDTIFLSELWYSDRVQSDAQKAEYDSRFRKKIFPS